MVSRNEQSVIVYPPIRGFNTKDPPQLTPEGMGNEAFNMEIAEVESVNKRSGMSIFNSSTNVINRASAGSIREITGAMVYGSGTAWTASIVAASDTFRVGSGSNFYLVAALVGTATLSLASAFSGTNTNGSYTIGPKEIDSIYPFNYGTTQKMIVFAGSDGYVTTPGLTGTFNGISAALTSYAKVAAVTFQDKFWFCNGYEFKNYDGSSVAAASGSPSPSDPLYTCLYTIGNANYLAIAGSNTNANKSAFAFSDVNAPATWPAANKYFAGDRDNTVVTGIKQISGGVAIFKQNSIYVFSGIPGAGVLRKVISDVGCLAPKSLVAYEGVCYFIGKRAGKVGLFAFDGSPNVPYLSYAIEPTINALTASGFNNMVGQVIDGKYYLAGSSATWNNRHFVCYINRPFNANNQVYFPWTRGDRAINAMGVITVSSTDYLFSGSPVNGFVYVENNGTSDNTEDNILGSTAAINAYADTAWLALGDDSRRKEVLRAYIPTTQSGAWDMKFMVYKGFQTYGQTEYPISLDTTTLTWAEVIYLQTPWQTAIDKEITELVMYYPNISNYFKFRFANSQAAQPFAVYPITLKYKMENR